MMNAEPVVTKGTLGLDGEAQLSSTTPVASSNQFTGLENVMAGGMLTLTGADLVTGGSQNIGGAAPAPPPPPIRTKPLMGYIGGSFGMDSGPIWDIDEIVRAPPPAPLIIQYGPQAEENREREREVVDLRGALLDLKIGKLEDLIEIAREQQKAIESQLAELSARGRERDDLWRMRQEQLEITLDGIVQETARLSEERQKVKEMMRTYYRQKGIAGAVQHGLKVAHLRPLKLKTNYKKIVKTVVIALIVGAAGACLIRQAGGAGRHGKTVGARNRRPNGRRKRPNERSA